MKIVFNPPILQSFPDLKQLFLYRVQKFIQYHLWVFIFFVFPHSVCNLPFQHFMLLYLLVHTKGVRNTKSYIAYLHLLVSRGFSFHFQPFFAWFDNSLDQYFFYAVCGRHFGFFNVKCTKCILDKSDSTFKRFLVLDQVYDTTLKMLE